MTSKLPALFSSRTANDIEKWIGDMNNVFIDLDRMFDRYDKAFPVSVRSVNFPPVDIVKTATGYEITLAVAGYTQDDLKVEVDENDVLVVSGKIIDKPEVAYLFKGIATRQFVRKWQLLDHDEVGSVSLKNGLLTIVVNRKAPPEPAVKRLTITAS